jgi:hypothetical protein
MTKSICYGRKWERALACALPFLWSILIVYAQAGPFVLVLTLPVEPEPGPPVVSLEALFAPGSETVSALLDLVVSLEALVVSVWALVTPGRSYSTSAVVVST